MTKREITARIKEIMESDNPAQYKDEFNRLNEELSTIKQAEYVRRVMSQDEDIAGFYAAQNRARNS